MKKLINYPLFIIGAIILHLGLVKGHVPLIFVPSITISIVLIFIIVLERINPYRNDWNQNLGDFKNDFLQTFIVLPIVVKFVEFNEVFIQEKLQIHFWPSTWPFIFQLIAVVLLAEFLFYWFHRFSHTNKTLIKFHAVHHGALRVYWANAGRFHIVDSLIQGFLYFIPIYILGASKEVAAMFLTLNAVTGTLEHANFDFKTIILSRIFNTAELHRLHHSVKIHQCNSNYGKILSIWDSVFGTYEKPKFKREDLTVGLPGGRPVPVHFWGQMTYPFEKKKKN